MWDQEFQDVERSRCLRRTWRGPPSIMQPSGVRNGLCGTPCSAQPLWDPKVRVREASVQAARPQDVPLIQPKLFLRLPLSLCLKKGFCSSQYVFLPLELVVLFKTFPKSDSPRFPSPELSQFPLGSHRTLHTLLYSSFIHPPNPGTGPGTFYVLHKCLLNRSVIFKTSDFCLKDSPAKGSVPRFQHLYNGVVGPNDILCPAHSLRLSWCLLMPH